MNTTITDADYGTLAPCTMVNGIVVSVMLDGIRFIDGCKLRHVSSQMLANLHTNADAKSKWRETVEQWLQVDCVLVAFPHNHNNYHWALTIGKFNATTFVVQAHRFNSTGSSQRQDRTADRQLRPLFSGTDMFPQYETVDVGHQVDGLDCGLYIGLYALLFALGYSADSIVQSELTPELMECQLRPRLHLAMRLMERMVLAWQLS